MGEGMSSFMIMSSSEPNQPLWTESP